MSASAGNGQSQCAPPASCGERERSMTGATTTAGVPLPRPPTTPPQRAFVARTFVLEVPSDVVVPPANCSALPATNVLLKSSGGACAVSNFPASAGAGGASCSGVGAEGSGSGCFTGGAGLSTG